MMLSIVNIMNCYLNLCILCRIFNENEYVHKTSMSGTNDGFNVIYRMFKFLKSPISFN